MHFEAGYVPENQNVQEFSQALRSVGEPIFGMEASDISMAKLLARLLEVTEQFGMETRTELLLLQRTMVVVEGVSRSLDPNMNMWETARPIVESYIKENLGPVVTEVSKVQEQLDKILSNLHRGTLTEQHYRDMKSLLHTISDNDRNPIFLAGKRLREWLLDRPSRNRNRSGPTPALPPPRPGHTSRGQTRPPSSTTHTVMRPNNDRQPRATLRVNRTQTRTPSTSRSRSNTPTGIRHGSRPNRRSASPRRNSRRTYPRSNTPRPPRRAPQRAPVGQEGGPAAAVGGRPHAQVH